tara:strand:- start:125 stop:2659 length:2535 start_codon:yes stop_codon:yes gene_type:complete
MKRQVELYIDNGNGAYTRADMFDFEDINYTTRIKDIRDIAKVLTDYSHSFTLPASGVNNKLFGHFDRFEVTGTFDARFKRDAIIKINGIDFRKGSISLNKANLKKGLAYSYSVNFFGETISLKQLIGDDKLDALTGIGTHLDDFDHIIDGDYISKGYGEGYQYDDTTGLTTRAFTAADWDYCFPFLSATDYHYYDSGNGLSPRDNGNNSRNIHPTATYNSSLDQYTGVNAVALKPAIKIKWIVKSIEQKYGITFSDDFFTDSNNVYEELFIWLNRERGTIEEQVGESTFELKLDDWTYSSGDSHPTDADGIILTQSGTELFNSKNLDHRTRFTITPCDASGVANTTGIWSFDAINAYNGKRDKQHINIQGAREIDCTWKSDGYKIPKFIISTKGGISHFKVTELRITKILERNFPLGDLDWDWYGSFDLGSSTANAISEGLSIRRNLPDMTVMKFLTTLFKMFNLTAYYDNGIIQVKTLDNYYAAGRYFDISKFVDYNEIQVSKTLLYNKIDLLFEGQDTFALKQANAITGDEFGNERVDHKSEEIGSILAFDGNEKYEVKLPLEKLMYERMTNQNNDTELTSIQWGWMVNDDSSAIKGKPTFMYCNKVVSATEHRFSYTDGGTSVMKTQYIAPSNVRNMTDNTSGTINFGSEFNEFTGQTVDNSLFELYYKEYIKSIYNEQSRLFEFDCYLPVNILLRIKPNDKLVINNKRYKINKFETNLTDGKTKLELINETEDGIVIESEVDDTVDDTAPEDDTETVTIVSFSSTTSAMSTTSNACSSSIGGGDVLYTNGTYFYPVTGDYVYTDAAGTIPAAAGWYKHQYGDLYKLSSTGLVIENDFCTD